MSGISAIYFLDRKGRVIIFRNYRGEVDQNISEGFIDKVLELDEYYMKPAFTIDDVHYIWIKHQNIYLVAVGKRNINAALAFSFLYKLRDILIEYFEILEEETVKDNFVLIYELLDEIMDNGYPQTTEISILKDFITVKSNKKIENKEKLSLTNTMTNIVSWRKDNIKYKQNELWIDINEKIDLLISSNGNILSSQINGTIDINSLMSGMPKIILGLNDKVALEHLGKNTEDGIEMGDLKFHQCVNKKKFDNDRIIEFIPPDGKSELMSYRLNINVKPLISVKTIIENISDTRMRYSIKILSNYRNNYFANEVSIYIPVPLDIQNAEFRTFYGNVVYLTDKVVLLWNIKRIDGQSEIDMVCDFQLPTVRINNPNEYLKRPIQVCFDIPNFTISGIQVRFLKIEEKTGYQAVSWVRYHTKNGDYSIRII